MRSDDVDAVGRLPLLNESYYRDILCEIGGMFAIANSVDNVHKRLWIGFQSWRAGGRKVCLMVVAHAHTERPSCYCILATKLCSQFFFDMQNMTY